MTQRFRFLAATLLMAAAGAALADARDDFIRAIKQDNGPALRALLQDGVDPNLRDPRGVPGLYLALQDEALNAARALLESRRLKAEDRTPTDESVLMMAAFKGQLDIVRQLIARGADVNKPGWTPLHYAATNAHLEVMNLLLEEHAFIDAESPNGSTPLMVAAGYGNAQAVQLLIDAGADLQMRNQQGLTAQDFARRAQRADVAALLDAARRSQQQQGRLPKPSW